MSSVLILKVEDKQWLLRLAFGEGTDQQFIRLVYRRTLIECLDVARTLQIHVDNASTLPLNQYQLVK
jgi:hypothetical protein